MMYCLTGPVDSDIIPIVFRDDLLSALALAHDEIALEAQQAGYQLIVAVVMGLSGVVLAIENVNVRWHATKSKC